VEQEEFDVCILGGGHAGVEAAYIASQFNLKIALVTLKEIPIASTPCNPSVGGVGKGQVVREIDALGGLMGKIADKSGIHFKTLNESKGPAVWSTRVQVDIQHYPRNALLELKKRQNLTIKLEKIVSIKQVKTENNSLSSHSPSKYCLIQENQEKFFSKKVIITAGTFLDGVLHVGTTIKKGGRPGQMAFSVGLGELLPFIPVLEKRFKTGTPPRLDKETLLWEDFLPQESEKEASYFHWEHLEEVLRVIKEGIRFLPQITCFLAKTNHKTHKIIQQNKHNSPLFNGQIKGIGPRYCPSIEDKVFRYPERDSHPIFLGKEGWEEQTVYPSGISTSLPEQLQEELIHSIKGLENAKIIRYGQAVEYDVVDTAFLSLTLEHKDYQGLYFAGQINGTSGYEEAAGQGIIAGINAALSVLERPSLILSRYDSYIGVMIEDLVSSSRDEPYRLFSSRAENRLLIREDNAYLRMAPYRKKLGLKYSLDEFLEKNEFEMALLEELKEKEFFKEMVAPLLFSPETNSLFKNLSLVLSSLSTQGITVSFWSLKSFLIQYKYTGHIAKFEEQRQKNQKILEKEFSWEKIVELPGLSNECKERIRRMRPKTLSQLKKISGIRPSTLVAIASWI